MADNSTNTQVEPTQVMRCVKWMKTNPGTAIFTVLLIAAIICIALWFAGVFDSKSNFTERTAEGLRYDWNRRRLLKDDRKLAIGLVKKNYDLDPSLPDTAFVNFTDFSLVKFIEDSDTPDPSRRAKVRLMLHPEFRKYQDIVNKASMSETRSLGSDANRSAIYEMLKNVDIIMPPLDATTDIQLIVAWQNTKSPLK